MLITMLGTGTHAEQLMRPANVELTLGHDIGVSESYYKSTEREILDDYLKAVEALMIDNDKLTLQKQVADLTQKSEEENYVIKGRISEKEEEIHFLRERDSMNTDAIASLSDKLAKVIQEIQLLKNQK